nr:uncharacterized protein LOC113825692 [Penaeus vannamei]
MESFTSSDQSEAPMWNSAFLSRIGTEETTSTMMTSDYTDYTLTTAISEIFSPGLVLTSIIENLVYGLYLASTTENLFPGFDLPSIIENIIRFVVNSIMENLFPGFDLPYIIENIYRFVVNSTWENSTICPNLSKLLTNFYPGLNRTLVQDFVTTCLKLIEIDSIHKFLSLILKEISEKCLNWIDNLVNILTIQKAPWVRDIICMDWPPILKRKYRVLKFVQKLCSLEIEIIRNMSKCVCKDGSLRVCILKAIGIPDNCFEGNFFVEIRVLECLAASNITKCWNEICCEEFDFRNWLKYVPEAKKDIVKLMWAILVLLLLFYFICIFSMCIGDMRPYGDRLFCCRFCGTGDEEIAIAAAAAAAAGASSNNASQTAPVQQICVVPNESDDAAGKKVQNKEKVSAGKQNPGIPHPFYGADPSMFAEPPGYGLQHPLYGTHQPVYGDQHPVYGPQQPVFGPQELEYVTQQPVDADQPMNGSEHGSQEPVSRTHQLECINEQPGSEIHQSECITQQPVSEMHQKECVTYQSGSEIDQAGSETQQPEFATDQPGSETPQRGSEIDQPASEKQQAGCEINQPESEIVLPRENQPLK